MACMCHKSDVSWIRSPPPPPPANSLAARNASSRYTNRKGTRSMTKVWVQMQREAAHPSCPLILVTRPTWYFVGQARAKCSRKSRILTCGLDSGPLHAASHLRKQLRSPFSANAICMLFMPICRPSRLSDVDLGVPLSPFPIPQPRRLEKAWLDRTGCQELLVNVENPDAMVKREADGRNVALPRRRK